MEVLTGRVDVHVGQVSLAHSMIAADLAPEGVREGLFAARMDVVDVRLNDDIFSVLSWFSLMDGI